MIKLSNNETYSTSYCKLCNNLLYRTYANPRLHEYNFKCHKCEKFGITINLWNEDHIYFTIDRFHIILRKNSKTSTISYRYEYDPNEDDIHKEIVLNFLLKFEQFNTESKIEKLLLFI